MNYFEEFPLTYYTLDDKKSVQVIKDITRRVSVIPDSITNLSMYEEVDVDDGSPAWIIADIYYNNPELYWIILLTNEIIDPRFSWPMSYTDLVGYVDGKYPRRDGHHHYEDGRGNIINGRLYLFTHDDITDINPGDVIRNNIGKGVAVVTESHKNDKKLRVVVTEGGFMHLDSIRVVGKEVSVQLFETDPEPDCVPITNYLFESRLNDERRRIKILKPVYLNQFMDDFRKALA